MFGNNPDCHSIVTEERVDAWKEALKPDPERPLEKGRYAVLAFDWCGFDPKPLKPNPSLAFWNGKQWEPTAIYYDSGGARVFEVVKWFTNEL